MVLSLDTKDKFFVAIYSGGGFVPFDVFSFLMKREHAESLCAHYSLSFE